MTYQVYITEAIRSPFARPGFPVHGVPATEVVASFAEAFSIAEAFGASTLVRDNKDKDGAPEYMVYASADNRIAAEIVRQ